MKNSKSKNFNYFRKIFNEYIPKSLKKIVSYEELIKRIPLSY